MHHRLLSFVLTALAFALMSARQVRSQDLITLADESGKSRFLTLTDLAAFATHEVSLTDKKGMQHTYKGVYLLDAVESLGIALGKELHGKQMAKYVLVTAADDYQVVFSLAEIDPGFTSNKVLIVTHKDGLPLEKEEGPFRLASTGDQRPTRWVRNVQRIQILSAGTK